jgi:mannose-6-phosphate isomerase-like protein (cupin superfamily)
VAREVHGEQSTLAVVELEPGALVPEHHHANEQLGLVLQGTVTFRVADETKELGPGGTWCIPADVPHEVSAGPEGAVVIDIFAPVRADWGSLRREEPRAPNWPWLALGNPRRDAARRDGCGRSPLVAPTEGRIV